MRLLVKPVYGWGWFREDGGAVDVPPPFSMDAETMLTGNPFKMAQGCVMEEDHPLSGKWIVLLQRHTPADGDCNLYVAREKLNVPVTPVPFQFGREITGFANVKIST